MPIIIGNSGVNRSANSLTVGISGVNKAINNGYVGVSGTNRPIFTSKVDNINVHITREMSDNQVYNATQPILFGLREKSRNINHLPCIHIDTGAKNAGYVTKGIFTFSQYITITKIYFYVIYYNNQKITYSNPIYFLANNVQSSKETLQTPTKRSREYNFTWSTPQNTNRVELILNGTNYDASWGDTVQIHTGDFIFYAKEAPKGIPLAWTTLYDCYQFNDVVDATITLKANE